MLKKAEFGIIALSLVFVLLNILGIIFFVSPNGLNSIIHVSIAFTLIMVIISFIIIIKVLNRKYANRLFLIVNILCSIIAITGLTLILYNLPYGFYLPVTSINGQYVDGTNQIISGIMSIVISFFCLYVFYVIHRAIYHQQITKNNDEE